MAAALKIDHFNLLDDGECDARIVAAKKLLGKRLCMGFASGALQPVSTRSLSSVIE